VRVSVSAAPLLPDRPVLVAEIPSSRRPGQCHRVRLLPDGSLACDCEAYYYQSRPDGQCRHVDEARETRERLRTLAFLLS
jgi:hypothetical protein